MGVYEESEETLFRNIVATREARDTYTDFTIVIQNHEWETYDGDNWLHEDMELALQELLTFMMTFTLPGDIIEVNGAVLHEGVVFYFPGEGYDLFIRSRVQN